MYNKWQLNYRQILVKHLPLQNNRVTYSIEISCDAEGANSDNDFLSRNYFLVPSFFLIESSVLIDRPITWPK